MNQEEELTEVLALENSKAYRGHNGQERKHPQLRMPAGLPADQPPWLTNGFRNAWLGGVEHTRSNMAE
jgi:hypothetical protein